MIKTNKLKYYKRGVEIYMIRDDGKIVIQRRLNCRLKNIVLRDNEIEEIYRYQKDKIDKQKNINNK